MIHFVSVNWSPELHDAQSTNILLTYPVTNNIFYVFCEIVLCDRDSKMMVLHDDMREVQTSQLCDRNVGWSQCEGWYDLHPDQAITTVTDKPRWLTGHQVSSFIAVATQMSHWWRFHCLFLLSEDRAPVTLSCCWSMSSLLVCLKRLVGLFLKFWLFDQRFSSLVKSRPMIWRNCASPQTSPHTFHLFFITCENV